MLYGHTIVINKSFLFGLSLDFEKKKKKKKEFSRIENFSSSYLKFSQFFFFWGVTTDQIVPLHTHILQTK